MIRHFFLPQVQKVDMAVIFSKHESPRLVPEGETIPLKGNRLCAFECGRKRVEETLFDQIINGNALGGHDGRNDSVARNLDISDRLIQILQDEGLRRVDQRNPEVSS